MSLLNKSAHELASMLASKEISSVELTKAQLENIDKLNPKLNSYLTVTHELALAQAREVDNLRAKGEKLSVLAGVPIAVKDNLTTVGIETTAGSKILQGWVPPYNATVVEKILAHRMPILGKTNLDELLELLEVQEEDLPQPLPPCRHHLPWVLTPEDPFVFLQRSLEPLE